MDASSSLRHQVRNLAHSAVLLLGMAGLSCFLGYIIAGPAGVVWAFLLAVLVLLLTPRLSSHVVLGLYGARPLRQGEVPALYRGVEELARRAGLNRAPRLYYIRSAVPNAFSAGSGRPALALTDGMLRTMSLRELLGVLAHEMSHIRHRDMWVMGLADLVGRITSFFSFMGMVLVLVNLPLVLAGQAAMPWLPILVLVFAPTLSALMQLALSRSREFEADREAARLTGDPDGLASALRKMEHFQQGLLQRLLLPGRRQPNPSLLRTHPHTDERVRRLRELAGRTPEREPMPDYLGEEAAELPRAFRRVRRAPRWHVGGFWY